MKKLGIILAAMAALIAYKLYQIPVPKEAVDTYPMKIFLASFRLYSIKVCDKCFMCNCVDLSVCVSIYMIAIHISSDQWRIQDFPQGGAPTPKIAIIFQIFVENCMKMKEFGPPGGRPWRPP